MICDIPGSAQQHRPNDGDSGEDHRDKSGLNRIVNDFITHFFPFYPFLKRNCKSTINNEVEDCPSPIFLSGMLPDAVCFTIAFPTRFYILV
jgi:hypothetical protein